MAAGKSASEQLVVELVGRTDKLDAEIARLKKDVGDLSSTGAKGTAVVGDAATGMGEKFGRSARQVAMATENMARMGKVGGESMKQLIAQGGEMAFMFGGGGAVVGALGIATLAIVEMFQRSRREMMETRRQFDENLSQMVRSKSAMGLSEQATLLLSGEGEFATQRKEESAPAFEVRKSGIAAVRLEVQALTEDLKTAKQARDDALEADPNTLKRTTSLAAAELMRIQSRLTVLQQALKEPERNLTRTQAAFAKVIKGVTDEARNALDLLQDKAGEKTEEGAAALAKYNFELEQLATKAEEAKEKSEDLARAAGVTLKQSIQSALGELTGQLADAALQAIDARALALAKEALANDSLSVAEKERLLQQIALMRQLERQRALSKDAMAAAGDVVSRVGAPGRSTNTDLTELMAVQVRLTEERRKTVALGGDTREIDKELLDIDKKREEIRKRLLGTSKDTTSEDERQTRHVRDQAVAIQQAVDGTLQLAAAFGLVDENTTNILRSIGQMAAQIPVLLDEIGQLGRFDDKGNPLATTGSVIGAALPVVGAVATLAKSLGDVFSKKPSAAESQQIKTLQDNTRALRDLVAMADSGDLGEVLGGLSVATARTAQTAVDRVVSQYGRAAPSVLLGGGGATDVELLAITKIAKQLGIDLDGTEDSFYKFIEALKITREEAEKRHAQQQQHLQEDLEVRRLRAEGHTEEADAMAFAIAQQRELTKYVDEFADAATQTALAAAQAAEAEERLADKRRAAAARDADIDIALGGDEFDEPPEVFRRRVQQWIETGGAFADFLKTLDLSDLSPENMARVKEDVRAWLKEVMESPEAFDLAGMSIDELIDMVLSFADAADAAAEAVENAAKSMYRSSDDLDAYWDVNETPAMDQVGQAAKKYNIDNFDQFDLTTQSGRDAAIEWLKNAFNSAMTAEEAQGYRSLINMIRALPPIGGMGAGGAPNRDVSAKSADYTATAEIRTITVEQGGRMLDTMTAIYATLVDIKALLIAAASTIITPPGFFGAGSGGSTITLNIYQAFYGPVGTVDRLAAASFADEVIDQINRKLGLELKNATLLTGNTFQR